ncbi:nitroreductase family protein [candidate division KSB1 bacterium]
MEELKAIFSHRSIRKYKDKAVDDELLRKILEAGFRGSTTGNMQLYSIIVTKEAELKRKLWENHFKQDMVNQAPVVLTFCADINRFDKWCELREAEPGYDNFLWFINAAIDAIIAAQNICIAAEANGLGICYLGTTTYMADNIIKILNCPKGVVPVTTVVIGYPDENPELVDRLPYSGIIHEEAYHDYDANAIEEIYQEKENLELTRQLLEENQVDNLAKVFTEKRYLKKDNVFFSQKFIKILEKQGFMNNK